jgi:spore germination cell wall hydrolase CwlJ-like protein
VYEARGESLKGQYSVAWVIKNRAEGDNRFPDGIVEVIRQPYQFSYLQDMHQQRTPALSDWKVARRVAYNTLNELVASPIGDATHYHASRIQPYWSSSLQYVASVGNHIYYKE